MMPYSHQHQHNNLGPMAMSRSNSGKHHNFSHQQQSNYSSGMMMQQHQQSPQNRTPMLKNEVFVGNLSYFCDENDLYQLFDNYADVTHVRIVRNAENNRTLMFGFVTLSTVNEAKEMSKLLTGQLFMGRKLRVDVCYQNHDPKSNPHTNPGDEGVQLHVSFSSNYMLLDGPQQQQLIRPTEFLLRKIFIKFGTLVDASVKEYNVEPTIQEGYGFVTFESFEDAARVPKQITVQGINFLCSLTHKHNPTFKHGGGMGMGMGSNHHGSSGMGGRPHQHHQHGQFQHVNPYGGGSIHSGNGSTHFGGHSNGIINDMGMGTTISREHSGSGEFGTYDSHDISPSILGRLESLQVIAPSGFSNNNTGNGLLGLNAKHGPLGTNSTSHLSQNSQIQHVGSISGSGNLNASNHLNYASNHGAGYPLSLNGPIPSSSFGNSMPPANLSIVDRFIGFTPNSLNVPGTSTGNSSPGSVPPAPSGYANRSNGPVLGNSFDAPLPNHLDYEVTISNNPDGGDISGVDFHQDTNEQ